jgi:uncharacterized alkaline shock family protein YloU
VIHQKAGPLRARNGRYDSTVPSTAGSGSTISALHEDVAQVPSDPPVRRSFATRRAVVDIVRAAALGSYGVRGFAAGPLERILTRLGLRTPGIVVVLAPQLTISLDLLMTYGVPIAEVARQVDSAVRHAVRRGLGREVGELTIRIDGLRFEPGSVPPSAVPSHPDEVTPIDLADSGSDVA